MSTRLVAGYAVLLVLLVLVLLVRGPLSAAAWESDCAALTRGEAVALSHIDEHLPC